ncbi:uncharacterized protein B0P05DRAFT_541434, partial [Gilbertella persicaria]|uniref:uncharacterized protein n=1 Tax=Gilbertella persicaria TaxID=101096 RepID=UPI00221EEBE7
MYSNKCTYHVNETNVFYDIFIFTESPPPFFFYQKRLLILKANQYKSFQEKGIVQWRLLY